jgi:outer membrane biosynthesis protein TonB
MPKRNRSFVRHHGAGDDWEYGRKKRRPSPGVDSEPGGARRRRAGRFAFASAFTLLFFAGASFTAGAGDQLTKFVEDGAVLADVPTETQAAAEAPTPEAPATETPAPVEAEAAAAPTATEAPTAPASAPEPGPVEPVTTPDAEVAPVQDLTPDVSAAAPVETETPAPAEVKTTPSSSPAPAAAPTAKPAKAARRAVASTRRWVVKRAAPAPAPAPEIEHDGGQPTIWLNRALPDPTPASARLKRGFARQLASISGRHGADWAAVLGVLRAQGERSSVPATAEELTVLAKRLSGKDTWKVALAVSGRTGFADRAEALADLYRSVGLESLVTGFAAAKERLTEKLLENEDVWVYAGGRDDLAAGRVDVRVVVLLAYLAERHESLLVSSLFAGHRTFARPGVVSAHVYGHAVDIAAVGGMSIAGHQQPGGPTEATVRSVLLLPAELQPQQVISLLGLGGPSFALSDHGDHIHVGY